MSEYFDGETTYRRVRVYIAYTRVYSPRKPVQMRPFKLWVTVFDSCVGRCLSGNMYETFLLQPSSFLASAKVTRFARELLTGIRCDV